MPTEPAWLRDLRALADELRTEDDELVRLGLLPPREGERERPKLTLIRGGAPAGVETPAHQVDRRPRTQRQQGETILSAVSKVVEAEDA